MASALDLMEAQVIEAAALIYQPNTPAPTRNSAQKYLEGVEKNEQSWEVLNKILRNPELPITTRQLAAVILKNMVKYGHTTSTQNIESLLELISIYINGQKSILIPLYACLINSLFHLPNGTAVFDIVCTKLSSLLQEKPVDFINFLRYIPEEVVANRHSYEAEAILRHAAPRVIPWLQQYINLLNDSLIQDPALYECLDSWANDIPLSDLISSQMIDTIFRGITFRTSFSAAISCLCNIYESSGGTPENKGEVFEFYRRTIALQPQIPGLAADEDEEPFSDFTKLFCAAAESWCDLIVDQPDDFRTLLQCVLDCVRLDSKRKVVHHTFYFWLKLSNNVADANVAAKFIQEFTTLFSLMIERVQYPSEAGDNSLDPFEGDKEEEDQFRDQRHDIGDVLKDCCLVIKAADCLEQLRISIEQEISAGTPSWQRLEALLFSVRAIARMVPQDSETFMSVLLSILKIDTTQNHKLLFQVIMVISRYTAWSSSFPETLPPQLDYIIAAFDHPVEEIRNAAASAFRYFGLDCGKHLAASIDKIAPFYKASLEKLALSGQLYLTEGVAGIISKLSPENARVALSQFCDPIVERILQNAQTNADNAQQVITDCISLISIFIDIFHPRNSYESEMEHAIFPYWEAVMKAICEATRPFLSNSNIVEQLCICWRMLVLGVQERISPLLQFMLQEISSGFTKTHDSRFLWVSATVLSTFRDGGCDRTISAGVFQFYEYLMSTFTGLDISDPNKMVYEIDDAYRLNMYALIYHPIAFFSSQILPAVVLAGVNILSHSEKLQAGPLASILRFNRCLLTYGVPDGAALHVCQSEETLERQKEIARSINERVKAILAEIGLRLTTAVFGRIVRLNPYDAVSDAIDLFQGLFDVEPVSTTQCLVQLLGELEDPIIRSADETVRLRTMLISHQEQVLSMGTERASRPSRAFFQELISWQAWLHPGEEE